MELWIHRIGGVAAGLTLSIALWSVFDALRRTPGRESGKPARILNTPVLLLLTLLYISVGVLLWQPLPVILPSIFHTLALPLGSLLFFPGLTLYLWGRFALGGMFGASSGFGVRLFYGHRLVTGGPYAYVRHPMYLGLILAGLGASLLYRTWTAVFFLLTMLGLVFRARREEAALSAEFGSAWQAYRRHTPAWIPYVKSKPVVAELESNTHESP